MSVAPLQRILAAVDFSSCSRVALAVADRMAVQSSASLHILHVHPVVDVAVLDFSYAPSQERLDAVEGALQSTLAEWSRSLRTASSRCTTEVLVGAPVEEIVRRSQDFDLAVLGTHGRAGVSRFFLGSVAERVVQAAACSVYIAKTKRP